MSYRSQLNSQWFQNSQPSKLEVWKESSSKEGSPYLDWSIPDNIFFSFLSLLENRVLKKWRKCILFVTKEVHFYSNFLPVGTSVATNSSHYRLILVLQFFSHFNPSFSIPKGLMCTRKNPNHQLIWYRIFGDTNLTNRRTILTAGVVYYQLYLARNL